MLLQVLPVDHEEQGQQHHRQHRGGQAWRAGQHLVGIIELGAHDLHAAAAFATGDAREVLGGLVGLLHRLGQVLHLAGDLAQLLRCFLGPFHRRADQLHAERGGTTQADAENQHRAEKPGNPDLLQHPQDRVADQCEEHGQQDRQHHVLCRPQGKGHRQGGQDHQRHRRARARRRRCDDGFGRRGNRDAHSDRTRERSAIIGQAGCAWRVGYVQTKKGPAAGAAGPSDVAADRPAISVRTGPWPLRPVAADAARPVRHAVPG